MKQIIIDNDGGTDDFLTLQYAVLSKQFDIKAITLVAGNTDINNVRNNVFKALEMAGISAEKAKEIGIYLPEHINPNIIADNAQGSNGLGGVEYTLADNYTTQTDYAEDVLVKLPKENPGKISILAIGPLTNIARAIEKDSSFAESVDELIIMGGDEGGGNITPYAEFNIYQDPEAAKKVFEAGFKKITMVGFNVSKTFTLSPALEHLFIWDHIEQQFVFDMTRDTADLDRNKNKADGASLNDVLTAMYLQHDGEFFTTKPAKVDVDISDSETRGQTVIIDNEGSNCNVVTAIDKYKLQEELFKTIFPEKAQQIDMALKYEKAKDLVKSELLQRYPDCKDIIHERLDRYVSASTFMISIASELVHNEQSPTIEKLLKELVILTLSDSGNRLFDLENENVRVALEAELNKRFPNEQDAINKWLSSESWKNPKPYRSAVHNLRQLREKLVETQEH